MHSPVESHPRSADLFGGAPHAFERYDLGRLVAAWAERGTPLPVAVVVSIFDDICAELETAAACEGSVLGVGLDEVSIGLDGVARWRVRPGDAVGALSRLLYAALSAGGGDDAVPAAARPIVLHGLSDDPDVRPVGPEPMRAWIRSSLGPPADREEVVGCCAVLSAGTAVEVPELATEEEPETEVVSPSLLAPLEVPSMVEPSAPPEVLASASVAAESVMPYDLRLRDPAEAADAGWAKDVLSVASHLKQADGEPVEARSEGPKIVFESAEELPAAPKRAVVRHELTRNTVVSLPTAPAARMRGEGLQAERTSQIELPDESGGGKWLLGLLALAAVGLVAYLLGLLPV